MATIAQHRPSKRKTRHNPLAGPLALFGGAVLIAAVYIGYVLWPRWPGVPVTLDEIGRAHV